MSNPLIDFHFDFETRSRLDIKTSGTVKYATDESTEATLLTWCFNRTGIVKAWRFGHAIPAELKHVFENPQLYNFIAMNVAFDYMIWIVPFARTALLQGIVPVRPKIENITGLEAMSQHFRMGASLDKIATMLDIPVSKDKEGRKLMLKQCKISAKLGTFPTLTVEEWGKFERYGKIDTVILREAYYKLPQLPRAERWIFEWTFKRNVTGIRLDTDLVEALDEIVQKYLPQFKEEFTRITGVKVNSTKAKDYFLPHFPWIEDMTAATVRDMQLRTEGVDPTALRALEIKALAGSTSIAKVACAKNMVYNGRIYDLFQYHMAQTKRFSGKGVQIHNFPRPEKKPKDFIPKDLNIVDLASCVRGVKDNLVDPLGFVKNLLRRIWLAEPGEELYCGDFSKVEPTVMRWMLGLGPVSKTAYEEMAVDIYGMLLHEIAKDSEERQVGKSAELGGGYGMGHVKFKDQVFKETGIVLTLEFAKHVINTYRKKNAEIVQFWRDLQTAFRKAINGTGSHLCDRKLYVMPMQPPFKGVQIKLPSGSYLYYHKAEVRIEMKTREIVEVINNQTFVKKVTKPEETLSYLTDKDGRIMRTSVYGGLLCEHVTSATARDLLTHAMYQLDEVGFNPSVNIHDEIWGGARPGGLDLFEKTMCILPYWCPDLVITADVGAGVRYLK